MAAEGLPKGGAIGFELFDTNSLGMSEFYQEVNYRRALEGELARTIASLDAIDEVRVHLVIPQKSLYVSQAVDPTASIMVRLAPGATLAKDQIRAIRYLVAGSVEGLNPDSLAIVDTMGNTLAAGGGEDAMLEQALDVSAQQLQIQRNYEQSLETQVQAMLEQLVGPGNAVVKANVTMDWNKVESISETFAPETGSGVLRSSHLVTETFVGTSESVGGIPGTASNLPPSPDSSVAAADTATSGGGDYGRVENLVNYEVSRVETRSSTSPGRVQRLAVSVLVDGITDAQQLSDIRDAVAAAAGYDEARGDVVTVKGMPFDRSYYEAEAEAMDKAIRDEMYLDIGKYVGLAILVVVLLLYVRGLLNSLRPTQMRVETPSLIGLPQGDRLAQLESERARQLTSAELTRALERGPEVAPRFQPDPRLEALIRRQSEVQVQSQEPLPIEEEPMKSTAPEPPPMEDEPLLDDEAAEAASAREARQRIQRQVAALARSEPRAVAQVIRSWLTEGK